MCFLVATFTTICNAPFPIQESVKIQMLNSSIDEPELIICVRCWPRAIERPHIIETNNDAQQQTHTIKSIEGTNF